MTELEPRTTRIHLVQTGGKHPVEVFCAQDALVTATGRLEFYDESDALIAAFVAGTWTNFTTDVAVLN